MADSGTKVRITDYADAGPKTRIVIDYCARHQIVPREKDGDELPSWRGVSSSEVSDRIAAEFNVDISKGQPGFAWERLGAEVDVARAVAFLRDRREDFLDAGFEQLADWD